MPGVAGAQVDGQADQGGNCSCDRTNATHVESDLRPAGRRHVHAFNFKNFQPSFNQRRHMFICENACASSPTSTLHRLLIENRYILFARPRDPSSVRSTIASPFEEALDIATKSVSRFRTSEAASSPFNVRSAGESICTSKRCQANCAPIEKKICDHDRAHRSRPLKGTKKHTEPTLYHTPGHGLPTRNAGFAPLRGAYFCTRPVRTSAV